MRATYVGSLIERYEHARPYLARIHRTRFYERAYSASAKPWRRNRPTAAAYRRRRGTWARRAPELLAGRGSLQDSPFHLEHVLCIADLKVKLAMR
jgi:hypothetical protein